LAFLVRLQKYILDIQTQLQNTDDQESVHEFDLPNLSQKLKELDNAAAAGVGSQKYFVGGLTILPCSVKLSVAPARALTNAQATLEGDELSAIHYAVRKGDIKLMKSTALLNVKIGSRNSTPMAVIRGLFKSIIVDALLRLDGACLVFAGVSLRNHLSTSSQLSSQIGAHYATSLRQNVPALIGSLAAFGNPLGLVRGFGDGVR
jgi:Vacuolar-sorting-associated 13 protein C-terminal